MKLRRLKKEKDGEHEKKVKSIKDMTPREQRVQRSIWRKEYIKKKENKKRQESVIRILNENSPPTSDDEPDDMPGPSARPQHSDQSGSSYHNSVQSGLSRQNSEQSGLSRQNSDQSRLSSPQMSGNTTPVSSVSSRQKIMGQKVKKRNYNLMRRVIENQKKTIRQLQVKINTLRVQSSREKLKALQKDREVSPKRTKATKQSNVSCAQRKKDVRQFLECDENSRIMPGKKDTITRNQVKKQRRLLSDTLRNLFEKFVSLNHPYRISYATFCRLKPFWVLEPRTDKRETCLCNTHENFQFLVDKLHSSQLICEKSSNDVAKSVTCSTDNDTCMMRQCNLCSHKAPEISEFEDGPICYKKWTKISEQRIISGVARTISRVIKKDISSTKVKLVEELMNTLPKFLQHKHSWIHQSKTMSELRKNLSEKEVLIHMDFSENYLCKYGKEIQSMHFGASRQQITLHTVVTYHKSPESGDIITKSFCSLSECLRHDACAVFAHLKGIFARLLVHAPISSVHIFTDSPSAQYRNKKMFYLFAVQLVKHFNLQKASWHFHEAGHGKGAPDGIGAYVKRTADREVALGKDVQNLDTLYQTLIAANTKVDIFLVKEEEITAVDQLLSLPDVPQLKTVKNTMRVHQVYWDMSAPDTIYLRRLSCLSCQGHCQHFGIGSHKYDSTPTHADICDPTGHQDQEAEERYSPEIFYNRPKRRRRPVVLYSDEESIHGEVMNNVDHATEDSSEFAKNDDHIMNEKNGKQASPGLTSGDVTQPPSINFINIVYGDDDIEDEENIF
ncbi:hypothetical protein O0L34_g9039 [Tuta absoluta]|nr:hypothetical protein O0L34_g9039 [Tuta absoluta]